MSTQPDIQGLNHCHSNKVIKAMNLIAYDRCVSMKYAACMILNHSRTEKADALVDPSEAQVPA
jgi:hypothetical protein